MKYKKILILIAALLVILIVFITIPQFSSPMLQLVSTPTYSENETFQIISNASKKIELINEVECEFYGNCSLKVGNESAAYFQKVTALKKGNTSIYYYELFNNTVTNQFTLYSISEKRYICTQGNCTIQEDFYPINIFEVPSLISRKNVDVKYLKTESIIERLCSKLVTNTNNFLLNTSGTENTTIVICVDKENGIPLSLLIYSKLFSYPPIEINMTFVAQKIKERVNESLFFLPLELRRILK